MDQLDHLLTTTRTVRKRLDLKRPVEPEVIERCLEIAIQAPTGSNLQGWRWVVVTDRDKKEGLADLYRRSFRDYASAAKKPLPEEDPRSRRLRRVMDSAVYLAGVLERAPVHIVPCIEGRARSGTVLENASLYGSILPAVWSLMLALRSRGLGSCWTTLHLKYEAEAAELLRIPRDFTQTALLPVAYYTGRDFRPASRIPARELTYWNGWGKRRE